jgi:hypothetical protein
MKNKIQFQQGYSLIDLMKDYGTESSVATRCSNGAGLKAMPALAVEGTATVR